MIVTQRCSVFTLIHAVCPLPIHYRSRDHPKAHELTIRILHPSPAPCLQSPGCAGGAESFLCHRLGQQEVSPGYSQWK